MKKSEILFKSISETARNIQFRNFEICQLNNMHNVLDV